MQRCFLASTAGHPWSTFSMPHQGDLFVARVAGNVASPDLIASLEYATKYAGSKAILVLGHTRCGAVKGAWAGLEDGHLTGLLGRIQPAVDCHQSRSRSRRQPCRKPRPLLSLSMCERPSLRCAKESAILCRP